MDAVRLMQWSSALADRCPVTDIAEILRRLGKMNVMEVDRYVETFLQ
jgi:hypothetical protein